jgi:galactose-1-phosphate uridylyltransferase
MTCGNKDECQKKYKQEHGKVLLMDYVELELEKRVS